MAKTVNTRIKLKRDTSANWTAKNPVLLYGEKIYVDTSEGELRSKVGDGSKTYTQLPFEDEIIRTKIENKADASALNNYYTKDETASIYNAYVLNIDYDNTLAFNTSEIVIDTDITKPILGQAILGQMVLA